MNKKMKRIISLLLIAICLFTTLETSTLTVHAEVKANKDSFNDGANKNKQKNEPNTSTTNTDNGGADHNAEGGGDTGVGTTTGVQNGASEKTCGYRFYIVDKYGNSVSSHAVDLLSKAVENPTTYFADVHTRICNNIIVKEQKLMPEGMPKPYYYENEKFVGNGQTLRDWAISINSATDNSNIVDLILYAFGDTDGSEGKQIFNNWVANQDRYYAVLEPITWHGFFTGGKSDSHMTTPPSYSYGRTNMYGTFYNWYNAYQGVPLKNGNFTSLLDMFVLGTCMTLERDTDFEAFEGETYKLKKPTFSPSAKSDEQIGSAGKELNDLGFGIHLYMNVETADNQTTYDEPQGDTPAPPADESKGSYTIVKNYRYSEDGGATFTDAGCFHINFISENIAIEDEISYRVVGWKITDSTETKVDSLNWENDVKGTVKKSGTTSGHVKIEDGGRTLYVLLEKIKDGNDGNGAFLIESPFFYLG